MKAMWLWNVCLKRRLILSRLSLRDVLRSDSFVEREQAGAFAVLGTDRLQEHNF